MKKEGNVYDNTIKDFFQGHEVELIEYFGGIGVKDIRELNLEFARTQSRTCDFLFEICSKEHGRVVVHMEFQSSNDKKMEHRMLLYAANIIMDYDLPFYQLVLYLGAETLRMKNRIENTVGFCRLEYGYKIVDMGSIAYHELKELGEPLFFALLPLTDRKMREVQGEDFLRRCVRDILESHLSLEDKRETVFKAFIFSGLTFERETIEKVFKEVEQMLALEESSGYQMIFEKGLEKGLLQGMEKGLLQGREEGLLDSLRTTAGKLVIKKFKDVPAEYMDEINKANAHVLNRVIENIFDITSLEELEALLSLEV